MSCDPKKILHIVYSMQRGGMETCIMHFVRGADRSQFVTDFLVHTEQEAPYDKELLALGSKLHRNIGPGSPIQHLKTMRQILSEHGPYDVVHAHDLVWGPLLRLAARAGVPVRIMHSHNDIRHTRPERLLERIYCAVGGRLGLRAATHGLAVSSVAAEAMFGTRWQENPKVRVLISGREFHAFEDPVDSVRVRQELALPEGSVVIGHVGSLTTQKNHAFLLQVFAELIPLLPQAHLLLVGGGPLRQEIEGRVAALGLSGRVALTGERGDVPALLVGAMDAFLFPSHYEGLPGAVVEAQIAGLPSVISEVIAPETDLIPDMIARVPLSKSAPEWAGILCDTIKSRKRMTPAETLPIAAKSPFDMATHLRELRRVYRGEAD